MAPKERNPTPDLTHLAALQDAPERHQLFQALRLIEAVHADKPRLGHSRRPGEDPVRLAQAAEMAFPTSTITAFDGAAETPKLTQVAFGLFGPNGPLPLHLTEFARDRQRNANDPTMAAFADIFHHRMLSLLYRAWASGQPAAQADRAEEDDFGQMIAALAGYAGQAFEGRDAMPDVAKRHFAGLLAAAPRSETGLSAVVSQLFDAPVEIESFVGSWLHLEPLDRGRLSGAALGATATLGERVWSRQAKIRLRLGPLSLKDYENLLPGTRGFKRLAAVIRNFCGDTLDWEATLVLHAADVPAAVLGQTAPLGRAAWIGQRPNKDADDLNLLPPRAHLL